MTDESPIIYSVIIDYPDGPKFRIKAPHKRGFPSQIMFDRADMVLDLTNKIVLKDKNYRQFHRITEDEVALHSEYPLICMTCVNVTKGNGSCYLCKGNPKK
jgi:hypothetical protein